MVSMINPFASLLLGLLPARAVISYLHHVSVTYGLHYDDDVCCSWVWFFFSYACHFWSWSLKLSTEAGPICDTGIEADFFTLIELFCPGCQLGFLLCRTTI